MTKLISQIDYTLELASGSYSENRYSSWRQVAKLLLAKGYEPKEAAAIMRSKWTRWAADAYETTYGKCPATAIIRFIDNPRNSCTSAAVKELVDQTFG